MFEALSDRLESAWKSLRSQDKISESNINEALREVRRALLEADVNLQVIKDFVAQVKETALGSEVIKGVSPDQQFIKIVHDELVKLMGDQNVPLAQAVSQPTVVLMAGLQGTGKTTATAKPNPATNPAGMNFFVAKNRRPITTASTSEIAAPACNPTGLPAEMASPHKISNTPKTKPAMSDAMLFALRYPITPPRTTTPPNTHVKIAKFCMRGQ